jgi:acyl-CoA thioesterase-1
MFVPVAATAIDTSTRVALTVGALNAPTHSQDCSTTNPPPVAHAAPLPNLLRAAKDRGAVRILGIGSSSTVGLGASKPSSAYIPILRVTLQRTLRGLGVEVIGRGVSGELAEGAADRMKSEVERSKPDLIVWQVGTNDALRHVSTGTFKQCLTKTITWLKGMNIDVVLINPQFGNVLAREDHYGKTVAAVSEVASEAGVPLIDRYQSMRDLQRLRGDAFYLSTDNLHMNDAGHRCVAEQLARALIGGLTQAGQSSKSPDYP